MTLVFERAKKEDLEEIHEIEIASFPDPWSVDSLWVFASDASVRTLVCAREEETGELVGYYALQYVLDEAEIAIIAVKSLLRFRQERPTEADRYVIRVPARLLERASAGPAPGKG